MKLLILALSGLFLPMQMVYYMDCCCGDFCTHKNACTGCEEDQSKACDVHSNQQPSGDCCKDQARTMPTKSEHHKKACAHMSPSSEVTAHAAPALPEAPAIPELLIDLPLNQSPPETGVAAFRIESVPRPAGHIALHLLLSVLQV
jgi:hypothetical protein